MELTASANQLTALGEEDGACDDDRGPERRTPCHSQWDHDQPAPPNQIGHYGPMWKDCLEEAKVKCRTVHVLSNPWPKLKMDVDSLTGSLVTVVVQWKQCGMRFEPG